VSLIRLRCKRGLIAGVPWRARRFRPPPPTPYVSDVTHVIIDVGGFLGIGEKPVALGYHQIHIGRDGANDEDVTVQLDQTEEQLEQMETYRG